MSKTEETAPDDSFNVVKEVPPGEWVDLDNGNHSEYVHVIVDRKQRELRCYRSLNEDFPSERGKTTIEDVRFKFIYDEETRGWDGEREVESFYLTWRQADTFLTWVDLLSETRTLDSDKVAKLVWYENNEKPVQEDSKVNNETIDLTFKKENGKKRHIEIMDTWQIPSNQMARYKDD